jgi:hypothetical protein
MNDWIHDYARKLARDPLPEDAEMMASLLVSEAKRGNLEAERTLCAVRLSRKGKEPIKAIEDWLNHALTLRFVGRHEDLTSTAQRYGKKRPAGSMDWKSSAP